MSNPQQQADTAELEGHALVAGAARVIGITAVVTLIVIGALISLAVLFSPPDKPNPNLAEQAVTKRIAKVGTLQLQDNTPREPKTGEQVYTVQCGTCHAAGALGSPKFGDKAAWSARNSKGLEALLTSALKGKNAMPPQAGGSYDELEIARAVVYMANGSGAKFPEPSAKSPAPSK
jgi:cytochrome c5